MSVRLHYWHLAEFTAGATLTDNPADLVHYQMSDATVQSKWENKVLFLPLLLCW